MKKAKNDYSMVLDNARFKDLYNSTLTCVLSSIGYDGVAGNDYLGLLDKILALGYRRKFDVIGYTKLSLETLSEFHDKKFMDNVMEALKMVGNKKVEDTKDAAKETVNGPTV